MTFGIDIASPQRYIDLARAKAEGVQFVIVKMGGLNVTPQYVAPYYRPEGNPERISQIDNAIAAGLPKGHYYLIGKGQTPEAQADFFVNNLYRFDPARDVLALDNEALDSNGVRWGDADAARFAKRVLERTGIPASRFWHYAGAADYRATGSWPQLVALGIRFWWAAYGSYPTGQTPDHQPSLQGSIPRWDVHQFTSLSRVAGYALDGNYSPHSIEALFGATPEVEKDDMPIYDLVRVDGKPEVWWVVDRLQRVHVINEATLAEYQAVLTAKGLSPAVKVVKSLSAYGADIGARPVVTISDEQIEAIATAAKVDPAIIATAVRTAFTENPLR